ncbi:hypothetical protein JHW43_003546 [Diplocarpon mali]|nr:hypothetical protein JHW43_003546 [Diplocarpon mali]
MEFGPNYSAALGMSNNSHSYYRVCPCSRECQAVMRTKHEAREEGKLYLDLRIFDKSTGLTGTSALHSVCAAQPIPSIGVICSARGELCCSHNNLVGATGSITMLQVIHGFEQSFTSMARRFKGYPGPEEVPFKVNSKL